MFSLGTDLRPEEKPDVFERLTPWLVSFSLTAGLGCLVQSANDGHVHATGEGLERHHHAYVGEHSHDGGAHDPHDGDEPEPESDSDEAASKEGFFAAAWVAQAAPPPATGLPSYCVVAASAAASAFLPPIRDLSSRAQPRAPPVVPASVPDSRAV